MTAEGGDENGAAAFSVADLTPLQFHSTNSSFLLSPATEKHGAPASHDRSAGKHEVWVVGGWAGGLLSHLKAWNI